MHSHKLSAECDTAVYVRVSSNGQSTASQLPDIEKWVQAHGLEVKIYRDTFTGKSLDRPGWNKLEADFRSGAIKRIIIWRLDRLGRTAKGLTALFEELVTAKINLISIKDGLDLKTPSGRLMANVLASVAQFEGEVRSERQMAGIAVARAEGKHLGRVAVGAGNGKRIKVSSEQIEQVKRLKAEEMPVAGIARATGLSRPTIYSIIAGQ